MLRTILFALAVAVPAFGSGVVTAAETIKIGALYDLTGGLSSLDVTALAGSKLKAELINREGGLLGARKIEIIAIDTKTDQQESAKGAQQILAEGIVAGLGYSDTTFVMAAAPAFQEKRIPFVTAGATHPILPTRVGDYMFMTPFGDDDQSYAIAELSYDTLQALPTQGP